MRFDSSEIWHMKYQFLPKHQYFVIKEKNISLHKDKPSKNPFNIVKNQEFESFTLCHFKSLISPKPMES